MTCIEAACVAKGFQFLEGPVWVAERQELIFSDIPASRIYRLKDGKVSVFREPSGQANGNALLPDGRLITCEHANRRVSRTETDGTLTLLATHYNGKRLNSPNDLVAHSDGSVYFTDPPYGVKPELRELDFQGVYRIAPDGNELTLLARDFDKPNGLAFSRDERQLYVADTERGQIRVFDVQPDGTLANDREFCRVDRPDGLRVARDSTLYIAALDGVAVFDGSGQQVGRISLPERPANLAFGDTDGRTLYICARTALHSARLDF